MALRDLNDEQLQAEFEQRYSQADISEFQDIQQVSFNQFKTAVNQDFSLIKGLTNQMQTFMGETLSTAVVSKWTPARLAQELIAETESGKLSLNSGRDSLGRKLNLIHRANTIARTELFRNKENTGINLAKEFDDKPVLVWITSKDQSVRSIGSRPNFSKNHKLFDGAAKFLSEWVTTPGNPINCRCTQLTMSLEAFTDKFKKGLLPLVDPSRISTKLTQALREAA